MTRLLASIPVYGVRVIEMDAGASRLCQAIMVHKRRVQIMDEATIKSVSDDAQKLSAKAACDIGSAVVAATLYQAAKDMATGRMQAGSALPDSGQPENSQTPEAAGSETVNATHAALAPDVPLDQRVADY